MQSPALPRTFPNPTYWVPSWQRKKRCPSSPQGHKQSWNLKQQQSGWFGCNQSRCQHQSISRVALWRYEELGDCQKDMKNPLLSFPEPVSIPSFPHPSLSACLLWLGYPAPPFRRTFVPIFFRPVRQGRVSFPQTHSCACESHCGRLPASPASLSSCRLQRREGKWRGGVCQHEGAAQRGWGGGGPWLLLGGRCGAGLALGTARAGPEDAGAAATFRRC